MEVRLPVLPPGMPLDLSRDPNAMEECVPGCSVVFRPHCKLPAALRLCTELVEVMMGSWLMEAPEIW